MKRFINELRDSFMLIGIPVLVLVLPWSLCYRLFRALSATRCLDPLSGQDSLRAEANSKPHRPGLDVTAWHLRRRLTVLLDHADYYIAGVSARPWLQRRVKVSGEWPHIARPGLAFTFHWGAGMLAQCHLHQQGRVAHMLVNAPQAAQFVGRTVLYGYIRARIHRLARVLGRPVIDAQTSLKPVLRALDANELILAVIDVPTAPGAGATPVRFLGRDSFAPRALFRLAVERQLPVTVYLTGIDFSDGSRTLAIHQLGQFTAVDALARQVFSYLDAAIDEESAAWHLWGEYHRFFENHPATAVVDTLGSIPAPKDASP